MAAQLAADLNAWGELAARNGLHQRLVAQAKGIFRFESQRGLVAFFLAVQGRLNARQGAAVAAVQVGHGLVGLLQQFALGIGHLVAQGDGGVFLYFHDGVVCCRG